MNPSIRDIMTVNPVVLQASESVFEAASRMKKTGIGSVLVEKDGSLYGIVTDRDLVLRVLARGLDAGETQLQTVCSRDLASLSPQDSVEQARALMRKKAIRHIPIVDKDKVVGIVTSRDLATGLHR